MSATHFVDAEVCLNRASNDDDGKPQSFESQLLWLVEAQVHATLAVAEQLASYGSR